LADRRWLSGFVGFASATTSPRECARATFACAPLRSTALASRRSGDVASLRVVALASPRFTGADVGRGA
jgi:hypothetical protein